MPGCRIDAFDWLNYGGLLFQFVAGRTQKQPMDIDLPNSRVSGVIQASLNVYNDKASSLMCDCSAACAIVYLKHIEGEHYIILKSEADLSVPEIDMDEKIGAFR